MKKWVENVREAAPKIRQSEKTAEKPCTRCYGRGKVDGSSLMGDGLEWTETCFHCKGTGIEPAAPETAVRSDDSVGALNQSEVCLKRRDRANPFKGYPWRDIRKFDFRPSQDDLEKWREKWEQEIKLWYEGYMRWHHFIIDTTTGLTPKILEELKEKAEKWDELSPIKTLVATMSSEEVLKALEAQRRLDNVLTASDEIKETLRDWAQWDSPALREIWKGFNKLDSILREAAEGRALS